MIAGVILFEARQDSPAQGAHEEKRASRDSASRDIVGLPLRSSPTWKNAGSNPASSLKVSNRGERACDSVSEMNG